MVPQKRQRSSLAELREQESQRQAEIFEKNVVGSLVHVDGHQVSPVIC